VLAAEITVESPDFGHLEPIVDATVRELERAGVQEKPRVALADAGYWHHEQMDDLGASGIAVPIPPDSGKRKRKGTTRRGWQGGRYEWMRRVLTTELGERLYRKRSQTVEPMFGHNGPAPTARRALQLPARARPGGRTRRSARPEDAQRRGSASAGDVRKSACEIAMPRTGSAGKSACDQIERVTRGPVGVLSGASASERILRDDGRRAPTGCPRPNECWVLQGGSLVCGPDLARWSA